MPENPWLNKYIFPGTYVPVLREMVRLLAENGQKITDIENLRLHYSLTIGRWLERFDSNEEKIKEKYGENFIRMWRFYLIACLAGFKYGESRLFQITFSNGINNDLPLTRDHLYS